MDYDKEYTTEELLNLKVFTVKKAKEYVKEKTGMGEGLFKECVRPKLKFYPMAINYKRGRPSHLVIPKKEVDRVIARLKGSLLDHYKPDLWE